MIAEPIGTLFLFDNLIGFIILLNYTDLIFAFVPT